MNKKKLTLASIFMVTAVAASTHLVFARLNNISKADDLYSVVLNSSNKYTSGSAQVIRSNTGADIAFKYSLASSSSDVHASLNQNGYINNTTPILGIDSFVAHYSGALTYALSTDGSSWSDSITITTGSKVEVTTNASYIKIAATSASTLTDLTINYTCKTKQTTYNVADYYNGYYSSIVSWTDGEDLKQQLHDLIRTGYTALPYNTPNWESNKDADRTQNSYLELDALYTASDIPAYQTNTSWQREHAFCASLMTGSTTSNAVKQLGRATDFHNLFAAYSSGNTSRGNKNYGNANAGGGADGYTYNTTTFEPGDKDKGRVARALFYMCTMYKDAEQDTKNNILMKGLTLQEGNVSYVAGESGAFAHGNLSDLLEWNSFEVDRLEMQHNTSVQTYQFQGVAQGNRNPYVDYPELVDYVYGGKKDQAGTMNTIKPSAIDLDSNSTEHRYYTIKDAKTEYGTGETFSSSDVTIYEVKKDFSVIPYTGTATYSFTGKTFADSDNNATNTITIGDETLTYKVKVSGLTSCSYQLNPKVTDFGDMVTKPSTTYRVTTVNTPTVVTMNGIDWTITFTTAKEYLTCSNVSGDGAGCKFGSTTYIVTGFTMETVDDYTVNAVYFKGKAANTSSSFTLKMSVGGTQMFSKTVGQTTDSAIYGGGITQATGKIKYEFTGKNSLQVDIIAFNEVA